MELQNLAEVQRNEAIVLGRRLTAYLADVLAKIANRHPVSRLDELLPWAYVKTNAGQQVA